MFGEVFNELAPLQQEILSLGYRQSRYSHVKALTAKRASYSLWASHGGRDDDIRGFDDYYRRVRYAFTRLLSSGFLIRQVGGGYIFNEHYLRDRLL